MTDPTREAFEAWWSCPLGRTEDGLGYADRETDAAWRAWQAALSARAQGEAVATVEKTRCGCHPETCCCGDYTLRINGRYVACGSQKNMREIADAINATPAARAVDVDEAMLSHIAAVIDGTLAHCEAKSTSEETSYIGGQCLNELANIRDALLAALTQPEAR